MKATFIKKLEGFTGDARLFRCDPPLAASKFVIVSAVMAMFSGPETYIFPATKDGKIANWGELPGSFRGALDHNEALENAGYTVAEDTCQD